MSAPSLATFVTLITGWVFAPRRTVTGMIVAAQAVGRKHHSAYHRLFASARWGERAFAARTAPACGASAPARPASGPDAWRSSAGKAARARSISSRGRSCR